MADRGPVGTADGRDGVETRVVTRPNDPGWRPPIDDDDPDPTVPTDSIAPRPRRRSPQRRTLTAGANGEIVPISYGRQQVGAWLPYASATGSDVYLMLVVGEGPLAGLESPSFGDSSQTTFAALGLVEGTHFNVYLGEPDQGIDPILAASKPTGVWKWAFPSTAYYAVKYNALSDAFQNVDPKTFRCISLGRKLSDHRHDSTMLFQNREVSDYPAVATLDFTRSQRFGLGAEEKEIEYASFDEAADDCAMVTASLFDAEPTTAPTVAVYTTSTGRIENGIFGYAQTFVDVNGVESILGPWSTDLTISNSTPTRMVQFTALEVGGANIVSKRMYRRKKLLGLDIWGSARRVPSYNIPNAAMVSVDTYPTSELGGAPPSSSSISQFRIGIRIDQEETVGDTINQLRSTFNAYFVFNNGKYQCHVDKARTATSFSWDSTKIVGTPTLRRRDPSEIPSQVVVNFVNAAQGFKPDSASWPASPEAASGVRRLDRVIEQHDIQGIPSYDQGLRVAKWLYYRAVAGLQLEWTTHQMGSLPVPMSIVEVGHGRFGLSASDWTVSACGPSSRETWTLQAEAQISYDTGYHVDPGTAPPDVDPPPPPGEPPAPSDNFILMIGMGLPFEPFNAPLDPPE